MQQGIDERKLTLAVLERTIGEVPKEERRILEYGLDSLSLANLSYDLEEVLGIENLEKICFGNPTIGEIIEYVTKKEEPKLFPIKISDHSRQELLEIIDSYSLRGTLSLEDKRTQVGNRNSQTNKKEKRKFQRRIEQPFILLERRGIFIEREVEVPAGFFYDEYGTIMGEKDIEYSISGIEFQKEIPLIGGKEIPQSRIEFIRTYINSSPLDETRRDYLTRFLFPDIETNLSELFG